MKSVLRMPQGAMLKGGCLPSETVKQMDVVIQLSITGKEAVDKKWLPD